MSADEDAVVQAIIDDHSDNAVELANKIQEACAGYDNGAVMIALGITNVLCTGSAPGMLQGITMRLVAFGADAGIGLLMEGKVTRGDDVNTKH